MDFPFDAVIFDCDGTLVDSEELNNLATVALLQDFGLMQYALDHIIDKFVGMTLGMAMEHVAAENGISFPANITELYVRKVMELAPQYLRPMPMAIDLVCEISGHVPVSVASNGEYENVIFSLEQTGLMPLFSKDLVFCGSVAGRPKPAPDLFNHAAERMGAAGGRVLVLEDSAVGVRAGKAAGMTVYGIASCRFDKERARTRMKESGADEVFESLIHIHDHLFTKKPLASFQKVC